MEGGWSDFPADARIRLITLRGTRGEIALHAGRALAFPGDVLMNLLHLTGLEGFILRTLGATGSPRVTPVAKLVVVADRALLKAQLLELAELSGLERVVPCHGAIVTPGAGNALREVAGRL